VSEDRIPLIVLAGSDRQASKLPPEAEGKHALTGFKAMDVRIRGQALIETLVERLSELKRFAPIYVAGPRGAYAGAEFGGARWIETDGSIGVNVQRVIERVRLDGGGGRVAFVACDVLPTRDELRELERRYDETPRDSLWYPLIRVPKERAALSSFGWKPRYAITVDDTVGPTSVLPGHWIVVNTDAIRMRFLFRILDLAYRTRNRSIRLRKRVMTARVLFSLLAQDALHVLRLRAPSVTWTVLRNGLEFARRLRGRDMSLRQAEQLVGGLFLKGDVRRSGRGRIRFPLLDCLGLAKDVDTEEEARELQGYGVRTKSNAYLPPATDNR